MFCEESYVFYFMTNAILVHHILLEQSYLFLSYWYHIDRNNFISGKCFLVGLSWETNQDTLQRYFGQYGEVIDCVVMKNSETGRSRGFGFVTFADPSKVDLVLKAGPHELDGRTVRNMKTVT